LRQQRRRRQQAERSQNQRIPEMNHLGLWLDRCEENGPVILQANSLPRRVLSYVAIRAISKGGGSATETLVCQLKEYLSPVNHLGLSHVHLVPRVGDARIRA
jgi:hypothetical protein